LDRVQEWRINGADASASNGEMSILREELSAIIPTPRPSHAGHGALSLGVQTRRRRATTESASTNEGDGAPERRKKKQRQA
jgi:hypothetical protein